MHATALQKAGRADTASATGARADLPKRFDDVEQLDEFLSRPSDALVADMAALDGDILILGVAGKMGPTLARLARNAAPQKRSAGSLKRATPSPASAIRRCASASKAGASRRSAPTY